MTVSDEMRSAIEDEAFDHDESTSAALRRIVAGYLRDVGQMSFKAAPSHHLGLTNGRYATRGRT